jgi:hypothetical protein
MGVSPFADQKHPVLSRSHSSRAHRLVHSDSCAGGRVRVGRFDAVPAEIWPKSFTSPEQALRAGIDDLKAGDAASSVAALTYAAEGGQPIARWKLGEMYADGVGVARDDVKAKHPANGARGRRADTWAQTLFAGPMGVALAERMAPELDPVTAANEGNDQAETAPRRGRRMLAGRKRGWI